jgi:6-phosphogluconate dehydrogenase (decarboxylating)
MWNRKVKIIFVKFYFHQVGPEGAGHFVKMVHNGIEYGDMQLICEAYSLMKQALGMSSDEMAQVNFSSIQPSSRDLHQPLDCRLKRQSADEDLVRRPKYSVKK